MISLIILFRSLINALVSGKLLAYRTRVLILTRTVAEIGIFCWGTRCCIDRLAHIKNFKMQYKFLVIEIFQYNINVIVVDLTPSHPEGVSKICFFEIFGRPT